MTHLDPKALEAGMAEEKVNELLAAEIRAETEKRLIRKLAEEGGGTWAAYMWMEIEAFFARTPTPVTEDVVLLNDLFYFLGGVDGAAELRSRIIAALSASPSPPKADGPGEDGWQLITDDVRGPVTVCCFGIEPDHNWLPMTAYRVSGGRWERPASRDGLPYEPTHWRPLPVSPSIKREA